MKVLVHGFLLHNSGWLSMLLHNKCILQKPERILSAFPLSRILDKRLFFSTLCQNHEFTGYQAFVPVAIPHALYYEALRWCLTCAIRIGLCLRRSVMTTCIRRRLLCISNMKTYFLKSFTSCSHHSCLNNEETSEDKVERWTYCTQSVQWQVFTDQVYNCMR